MGPLVWSGSRTSVVAIRFDRVKVNTLEASERIRIVVLDALCFAGLSHDSI